MHTTGEAKSLHQCNLKVIDPLKHGLGGTNQNENELEIDLCLHGQYQKRLESYLFTFVRCYASKCKIWIFPTLRKTLFEQGVVCTIVLG